MSNMKAELLLKERLSQSENSFAELVLWRVPAPVLGSAHIFKYRLAFIVDGVCVLRYDNEVGEVETTYVFDSPRRLLTDFWHDVDLWRANHE
jgi:Family of unknown function (DUF6516)